MPTIAEVHFATDLSTLTTASTLAVIGRKERLAGAGMAASVGVPQESWDAMLARVEAGDAGSSASTWVGARKIVVGVLPEPCSRHNSPSRAWAIPDLARKADGDADATVVLALSDASHAFASALAASRGFPLFSAASGERKQRAVRIVALGPDGAAVADARIQPGIDGVRLAARLVDAPTSVLHTDALVDEARAVAKSVGVSCEVLSGDALGEQGFGGLVGVGKAARRGPALVTLRHEPKGATRTIVWVGKGLVYDTGGLSLKPRDGMAGMKGDMGGAAAVLAAFQAAVQTGFSERLVAVLCVAENAIGKDATRPDDVLTMKSGKTVEVNNTDAEGRLVLADGVAWATETFSPDLLVDVATLTGAALVATGRVHAGIFTNSEAVEDAAVAAGKRAGEPVHPLLYAPELHRGEFRSPVADMKNSVKNRANAQASCAGQFIGNHLPDPAPTWLHIDIAGTAWDAEDRGTGFGVGLLMELGAAG